MPKRHIAQNLVLITRFEKEELTKAIGEMAQILEQRSTEPEQMSSATPLQCEENTSFSGETSSLLAPVLDGKCLMNKEADFHKYLAQGIPVVVTGLELQGGDYENNYNAGLRVKEQGEKGRQNSVATNPKGERLVYGPSYFKACYGLESCTTVDCETMEEKNVTVGDFFERLKSLDTENKWKLKDWPPKHHMLKKFRELVDALQEAVPFKDTTLLNGRLNLAAYYPSNGIKPDLGPKLYNAGPASTQGTTRLHMDWTDTCNIMPWAAEPTIGTVGYALWHLFKAEDSEKIRAFLRARGYVEARDLIHSQQIYLTPQLLEELYKEQGVRAYEIKQKPGMAVYIPAGCAHQVCCSHGILNRPFV